MKCFKWTVVALYALGFVLPAGAQIRFGLISGLNLANVSLSPRDFEDDFNFSSLTAIGFGGVLDLRVAENIALQLEPMFLQKGARFDVVSHELEDGEVNLYQNIGKARLSYLEIPAMLKVAFGAGTAQPYVMAGPMIGFLLSSKLSGAYQGIDNEDSGTFDEEFETSLFPLKSIDFGLAFGAGIKIPAGNSSIFIQGRYGLGLTDISDERNIDDTDDDLFGISLKNKGFQIMTGITFPVGQ